MPLIIIAAGVALLLVLMIGFKVNGFIALVLVAAVVGFAEGMGAQDVLHSIQNGIGGTLGGLAMILGFGAMLGRLISDTGAAQRIATTLINTFGKKRVQWALVITGLIVGLAMFLKSDSYCCCRSFLRLWPHRDCHCCMSGFQWSPPYPLRTASCRRIPALPLLRQF